MRKQVGGAPPGSTRPEGLDLERLATVRVTSEQAGHPIEDAFGPARGPGAPRWVAGAAGDQEVTLVFDAPQMVREVSLEIEETEAERTQELALALSRDGGLSFQEVVRQEFVFSPRGATFERETWAIGGLVDQLRLRIRPHKGGGESRASVTSWVVRG